MGNANLVKSGSFAVPTYDTTQYIIGSGSVKSTAGQMLTTPYTFSDINDALTISFWMRISSLAFAWDCMLRYLINESLFSFMRNNQTSNTRMAFFGSGFFIQYSF